MTESTVAMIADYLAGDISVQQLRARAARASISLSPAAVLSPESWTLNRLEHRLAEFANGDWTEDELRDQLRPLVQAYRTSLGRPARAKGRQLGAHWNQVRIEPLAESA